jgi:hypothetical protein
MARKPPVAHSLETLYERDEEAHKVAKLLWDMTPTQGSERQVPITEGGRFAHLLHEYDQAGMHTGSATLDMAMNIYNQAHADWRVSLISWPATFVLERVARPLVL